MSLEALALALVCAARPAALASVYALLSSSKPERPLAAYVIASAASSVIAGVIVVSVLNGVGLETGTSTVYSVIELAGGIAALSFAAAVATGRIARLNRGGGGQGDSRLRRHLRDPSLRVAAGAGVATHLPGLLYLLGLNAIAAGEPPLVEGLVAVLIFDAIWLAIPVGALLVSIRDPEAARAAIGRISAWIAARQRHLLILAFAVIGTYFTIRGSLDLFG